MAQLKVFEGTAEEIVEQIRASDFTGRLNVIVTPENGLHFNDKQENLADALADFLAAVDQQEVTPGKPLSDPVEREVSRLVAEKFAKQGHAKQKTPSE